MGLAVKLSKQSEVFDMPAIKRRGDEKRWKKLYDIEINHVGSDIFIRKRGSEEPWRKIDPDQIEWRPMSKQKQYRPIRGWKNKKGYSI